MLPRPDDGGDLPDVSHQPPCGRWVDAGQEHAELRCGVPGQGLQDVMVARSLRDARIPAWVQGLVQQLCGVSRVGAGGHRGHVYQCPGPLNGQRESTVVLIIQSAGVGAAACRRRRRAGNRCRAVFRCHGLLIQRKGAGDLFCLRQQPGGAGHVGGGHRCGFTRWLVGRDHGLEWRGKPLAGWVRVGEEFQDRGRGGPLGRLLGQARCYHIADLRVQAAKVWFFVDDPVGNRLGQPQAERPDAGGVGQHHP